MLTKSHIVKSARMKVNGIGTLGERFVYVSGGYKYPAYKLLNFCGVFE
ncbi:hypothetical protein PHET_02539 [Paragonimus heterotremus]|uniref:Uncharacterized protein n=1 Tax=Paragonimus heterotremus TaxID=100268 RepID=A0A8J4WII7_9TREM|nr:hypothetical protein PHET_02539 [Paragonimus heterotremus]